MRTLLINPPYAFSEVPIMPLGPAYIAAALENAGYEVEVLDLLVSKCSDDKVRSKIEDYAPDIVGMTSVTMNYPVASEILKLCKSIDRDITTVIGGPHVTFCPLQTLEEAPWVDVLVRGEGDQTMLEIVGGRKLEEIAGIAFRSDGSPQLTGERSLIQDLDALPLPARHLFPLSRYHALDVHASVVAGRGCPFNCIFCVGSKMGGRRARYRDPKLVVDEIEQALAAGFREVNLEDDLLTLNHKHVYRFCDEIIARGLTFNWSAFSRVDTVNVDLLRRMKEAGCTWLLYGIESGNQQILDTAKKKITLDMIRTAVAMGREAGIEIMASFIIGLLGETVETMRETFDFAVELETFFGFNVLAPFPGTEVRERAAEYGIEILTDDWSKYDANTPVTRTEGAGPDELNATLNRYFKALDIPSSELEADGTGSGDRAHPRLRSPLAWAVLSDDVIERVGRVSLTADPLEGLVSSLAEAVPYSRDEIDESVRDWYGRGLLRCDQRSDFAVWSWR